MNYAQRGAVLIAALLAACDQTAPQPTAQRLSSPPKSSAPTEGGPGSPNAPSPDTAESSPPPTAAPRLTDGLGKQAFLAANGVVVGQMHELIAILDGVIDEASARAAAPQIAEIVPRWKKSAEAASALFLTLGDAEQSAAMQEAAQASDSQLAQAQLAHGGDLIGQIRRIAQLPGASEIVPALTGLRDALLTTRGLYSPTTFRNRVAEKLGPIGSPLKVD